MSIEFSHTFIPPFLSVVAKYFKISNSVLINFAWGFKRPEGRSTITKNKND